MNWQRAVLSVLVLLICVSRLAHKDLVWVEEGYGLAAGAEMLRGKLLYRDLWFDKPPLYALYYATFGAVSGIPLRIAGSLFVVACCGAIGLFARRMWGSREGVAAAALLGFSLVFWIPSAVMAVAPDLLMIGPHIVAVYFAWRKRPLIAGLAAGIATLCNAKGVLVAAACVVWMPVGIGWIVLGWLVPQAVALAVFPWSDYWQQVWWWGFGYSGHTFLQNPLREGLLRTANWIGFHGTIAVCGVVCLWRERRWQMLAWVGLGLVGVVGGWRFFPRYYFCLLPVMALLAARGLFLLAPRWRVAVLVLVVVPMMRFGPTYWSAVSGGWRDTAMMDDSREVGGRLRDAARPGDTLVVWGYRPDIYVFSGLPPGARFLDSQPLTGVLADRHLTESRPTFAELGKQHRAELATERPTFVVDGLGPVNPALAIGEYSELRAWLGDYDEVQGTRMTRVYRRREGL